MSLKANYFKLGLFVVGAIIAGVIVIIVIGSGRWLQPRLAVRLTSTSRCRTRRGIEAQVPRRRHRRGDAHRLHLQQVPARPADAAARALVLVEAQIQPRLLGGRAAGAGDLSDQKTADLEIERGLRMRLAPQGITGTSYLEIDYVDPPPPADHDRLDPDVGLHSRARRPRVTTVVNAAVDLLTRLHNMDFEAVIINLNKLLVNTNEKVVGVDTKSISQRADRVLAKMELRSTTSRPSSFPIRAWRCSPSFALRPPISRRPYRIRRSRRSRTDTLAAIARVRAILDDPNGQRVAHQPVADAHADQQDRRRWRGRPDHHLRQLAPDHRQPA
jgi:hypothetical protein